MKRSDVMAIVARHRAGAPAVSGPGATLGALWAAGHQPATIYNMEMGYATPFCVGVAMSIPDQKVVALEGEGSAILGLPALATIGRYAPSNLVVVIFDNGVFGTGGGEVETAASNGTDIAAVARACGIDGVVAVEDLDSAESALRRAFGGPGPWIVVAKVERTDTVDRPRPGIDHVQSAYAFRSALSAMTAT